MRGLPLALLLTVSIWFVASLVPSAASAQVEYTAFTYFGGSDFDRAQGCAIDPQGFVWITGNTLSSNLPTPGGPNDVRYQTYGGNTDGFVAKFTPDLSTLLAASYIGGSGEDRGYGMTFDAQGSAYVIGITGSSDFPTTSGAFQQNLRGDTDVFIVKFSSDLSSVVFATLIGGSSVGPYDSDYTRGAIALDSNGNILAAGKTSGSDFPTTPGAYDRTFSGGEHDAWVAKLAANGSSLIWSTYIGGNGNESFYGNLEVHSDDSVTVGGFSNSTNFPTLPGAIQRNFSGRNYVNTTGDGVLVHVSSDGRALLSSTYLWGSVGGNNALTLDAQERPNLHTTAYPANQSQVPISGNAAQPLPGGGEDGVVTRINPDGSQSEVATFLGGSAFDALAGMKVDSAGNLFVSGNSGSSNFPVTFDADQQTNAGMSDAVFAVLRPDASLLYSTYLGGSGQDRGRCLDLGPNGVALVTGDAGAGMPNPSPGTSYDPSYNGGSEDAFLAVFVPEPSRVASAAAALLVLAGVARRRRR